MVWEQGNEKSIVWRGILVAAVVVAASILLPKPEPAAAAEPLQRECSASAAISGAGILAEMPKCSTGPVLCPEESAGCAFSASIRLRASAAVGPLRGRLRIRDVDTGAVVDFFCSSGAPRETCIAQPTAFVAAGTRLNAICSATKETVLIGATVRCAAGMSPLGEG